MLAAFRFHRWASFGPPDSLAALPSMCGRVAFITVKLLLRKVAIVGSLLACDSWRMLNAWGARPRLMSPQRARSPRQRAKGPVKFALSPVFTGSELAVRSDPGACAPGFTLTPASQAQRVFVHSRSLPPSTRSTNRKNIFRHSWGITFETQDWLL